MAKKTYKKKYMVDGEVVPGVTTVIKTSLGWGMGALIGWAVKVTKEGKDHRAAMESAADAGTLAHTLVENYCKALVVGEGPLQEDVYEGYTDEQIKSAKNAFEAFLIWKEGSKLSIVASEMEVICTLGRFGGTIDLVFVDDKNNIHICDIKTTNYLLPDHLIQVAGYGVAYEEQTGKPIVAGHLLRFNKGDATTFHHTYWSDEALAIGAEAFANLRNLYDLKKKVEGLC
jgi:CRISPR/Cas system-associated exonuclease Cas4 (RecB family)